MTQILTLQKALEVARREAINPEVALTISRIRIRMSANNSITPIEATYVVPKEILGELARISSRTLEVIDMDGLIRQHSLQFTHGDATVTLVANTALV